MTRELHTIWLMAAPADTAMLAALVAELSARFGTPPFVPHMTIRGDAEVPLARLEQAVAQAAREVAAFSEPVAAVEGGESFFRSFYARLALNPSLAALKQALDPAGLDSFMPHVSLLYGAVEPAAKAAALAEIGRRLAGKKLRFDRLGVIYSAQEIPIAEWREVTSVPLKAS